MEEEILFRVLDRLMNIELLRSYGRSLETGRLVLDWAPYFHGADGETAFRNFERVLHALMSSTGPLSEGDQQLLVLFRALLDVPSDPSG